MIVLFGFDLIQKKSLRQWLLSKDAPFPLPAVQRLDAVEGATLQIIPSSSHTTVVLNDGPDVENLTLVFPRDDISRTGQIVRIASLINVAQLNLTGSNIMNTVSAMQPNDAVGFQKIEETGWIRIV